MGSTQLDLLSLVLGAVAGAGLVIWGKRQVSEVYFFGLSLFLVAAVYVLFALYPFSVEWIKVEAGGVFLYLLFWRLGMRFNIGWIGVGWLLHPVWDLGIHFYGPGTELVPRWYVLACLAFDVVVGFYCLYRAFNPRRPTPRRNVVSPETPARESGE